MDCKQMDSMNFLFGQVIRFHHIRMHMLVSKLGIYPGQPPILFMLWRNDGLSQKEIAKKLNLKPATITVMLRRMEKAGLLERRTDSVDLRVSRVYLTQKGKEIRTKVEEVLAAVEAECFADFTEAEKLHLRGYFTRMRDNLMKNCPE